MLLVIVTDIQQPEQKSSSESSDLPDWLKPVEIYINISNTVVHICVTIHAL